MKGGRVDRGEKLRKQYLTFLGRKIFAMLVQHARYKLLELLEVGSCNFRWNDRYNGAEIFLLGSIRMCVCVCARVSLSLYVYLGGRIVICIVYWE